MTMEVRVWEETIMLPTYPADAPEKFPIFLDKRVYQGSSGRVYPNAFTERVSDIRQPRPYRAIFLENEYIQLMMLPEIGGRIHVGFDKTRQYDFFYRQRVIKPALVGLLGPWISGGVEFNWPQHHRPSTFMPVEHSIEQHSDGGVTVWLGEHEPMNRMKGMVGICLHPGKSLVEAKVRLYNRTPLTRTFLWWANMAVRVHEQYMAFFPPDVHWVADHARRAISSFPIARNSYYGVDYKGVDIRWYKNIPVPTSYMVTGSKYDFFGGYDYAKNAGVVHVADHHIAPGKKLWTWGSHQFGQAWDRELTDEDGPYIELMAGVYTDNQPDFSFLAPYETKSFSQFWYPIQDIGPAKNANMQVALNLEIENGEARIGVCPSEQLQDAALLLTASGQILWQQEISIAPGEPFMETVLLPEGVESQELEISIRGHDGNLLLAYRPESQEAGDPPPAAEEPPAPADIPTNDELYLTGLHLEQYRHATRSPEVYWQEALRRDPQNSRANTALGVLHLERGEFAKSISHLDRALARLTRRNPNPRESEAFYALGVVKQYSGDRNGAIDAFAKSAWNWEWQAPAYFALATLASRQGDITAALARLDQVLARNTRCVQALHLKAALLRHSGRASAAQQVVQTVEEMDKLDCGSQWEKVQLTAPELRAENTDAFFTRFRNDPQTVLDLALDYAAAGLSDDAVLLIEQFRTRQPSGQIHPMLFYTLAWLAARKQDDTIRIQYQELAAAASPDYCFPSRVEEMLALESALLHNESDAKAHTYLGMFLYDRQRREEAIQHWQRATQLAPAWSMPWRNLGLALFNVHQDAATAMACYARAIECETDNARLFYEWDQLQKRSQTSPETRLAAFEARPAVIEQRDDLMLEFISMLNLTGLYTRAIDLLSHRRFHPWEGGEGLVSGQWVAAHFWLASSLASSRQYEAALECLEQARRYPENLGEGKHLLTVETHLDYLTGVVLHSLGQIEKAAAAWEKAADAQREFAATAIWQAKAMQALGQASTGEELLHWLEAESNRRMHIPLMKIDYFATSLPNFLLFEDDLDQRNTMECLRIRGLSRLVQGKIEAGNADLQAALALDPNDVWIRLALENQTLIMTTEMIA